MWKKKSDVHISLFLGLALSESLNVVLLYMCNTQNAYNRKPSYKTFLICSVVYVWKCARSIVASHRQTYCVIRSSLSGDVEDSSILV